MATQRRCRGCRTFYDAREQACTECGLERYGVNTALIVARLNGHLYDMANKAESEKRFAGSH